MWRAVYPTYHHQLPYPEIKLDRSVFSTERSPTYFSRTLQTLWPFWSADRSLQGTNSDLVCCKKTTSASVSFCIEMYSRAWSGEGYWVWLRWRRVYSVAARQRARGQGAACGQVEQLGAANIHTPPHPRPLLFTHLTILPGGTNEYCQNTKAWAVLTTIDNQ